MNNLTDLQIAKQSLLGNTIALCKNGVTVTSTKSGIAPMMNFIADEKDLDGYSVADLIVGKAVAMLFVKAGIKAVYGATMSIAGKIFLEKHNIYIEYGTLVTNIENRTKTGICPMEATVDKIDDIEQAYKALKDTIERLRQK